MRGPERRATTASGNAIIRQRPRSRLIYTCIERGTFVQYVYFYIRVWGGRVVLLLLLLLPSSSSLFSFLSDSVILFIFFPLNFSSRIFIHSSDRLCGVHSPRPNRTNCDKRPLKRASGTFDEFEISCCDFNSDFGRTRIVFFFSTRRKTYLISPR